MQTENTLNQKQGHWILAKLGKRVLRPGGRELTEKLIAEYGYDVFAHRMNGFEFHALQSKGINGFCTQARIEEINRLIPEMENGRFEKRF